MAENLSTLMSVNSENKVTANILQTLSEEFEKMRVQETKKQTPDDQLLNYFETSANMLKDSKSKFASTEIENLKIRYKNFRYPVLDELQATCLAESLIKDAITRENDISNIRERHEYNKDPTPSTIESQDDRITVNIHPQTKTADPAIYGSQNHTLYNPQQYIIQKSDGTKYFTNIQKMSAKPEILQYSGTLDFTEISNNTVIYCTVTESLQVITTLNKILDLAKERGYMKPHLTQIFRHILQKYSAHIYSSYIDEFDTDILFNLILSMYKPFEQKEKIENKIKNLKRSPDVSIFTIAQTLQALNVKKFKLDKKSKANPEDRARKATIQLISEFTVPHVKVQVDKQIQTYMKLGENLTLDEVLQLIAILETDSSNRPTTDLQITATDLTILSTFTKPKRNIQPINYNVSETQRRQFNYKTPNRRDEYSPRRNSYERNRSRSPHNQNSHNQRNRSRSSSIPRYNSGNNHNRYRNRDRTRQYQQKSTHQTTSTRNSRTPSYNRSRSSSFNKNSYKGHNDRNRSRSYTPQRRNRMENRDYNNQRYHSRSRSHGRSNSNDRFYGKNSRTNYRSRSHSQADRNSQRTSDHETPPDQDFKIIKDLAQRNIFCVRCLSQGHLTAKCRTYSKTARYPCVTCNQNAYHFHHHCKQGKDKYPN